jgi:hypothetical protein
MVPALVAGMIAEAESIEDAAAVLVLGKLDEFV